MKALIVGVRGLGRELARELSQKGFHVTCAARTKADVDAVAAECGGTALVADLYGEPAFPEVDLAICAHTSGAPFRVGPVLEAEPAHLEQRLRSVVGALNFLQRAKAKTLIVIGTTLAPAPRPGFGALSAHQFALRALVSTAARELKPKGVHVAYLAIEGQLATMSSKEWMERHGSARAIPPQEVAQAILYLHAQDLRAWTHELALRPAASE